MPHTIPFAIPSSVRAVILDLDGTIYDKRGLSCLMALAQIASPSLALAEQRSKRALIGQYFGNEQSYYDAFFAQMCKGHLYGKAIARWWYFRVFMRLMVALLRAFYKPRAWVKPLISYCHEHGIYIAVYSDYGCVYEKLRALGLETNDFCYLVSAPQLGGLKPAKACAQQVLQTLQVSPEQALFVGDRVDTDGATAQALGAHFAHVQ